MQKSNVSSFLLPLFFQAQDLPSLIGNIVFLIPFAQATSIVQVSASDQDQLNAAVTYKIVHCKHLTTSIYIGSIFRVSISSEVGGTPFYSRQALQGPLDLSF